MRSLVAGFAATLIVTGCGAASAPTTAIAPDAPVITVAESPPIQFSQLMTGAEVISPDRQPAAFEQVPIRTNCKMPRASRLAKVAYVMASGSNTKGFVNHVNVDESGTYRNDALQVPKGTAKSFQGRMMANEFNNFQKSNQLESASRVDVVITETDAPVFLVLVQDNATLWNIQLAPGAKLDGVVMNSYNGGAIANGASASRTGFRVFADVKDKRCWSKLRGKHVGVDETVNRAVKYNSNIDPVKFRKEAQAAYSRSQKFFNRELPKMVGKPADWIVSGSHDVHVDTLRVVHIGPVPAAPFAYQPITRLQIPETASAHWGKRSDGFKHFGITTDG